MPHTKDFYIVLFDSIARWCTILIALLIPFFVIPAAWATPGQSKIALTAIVLIAGFLSWITARIIERKIPVLHNAILAAAILLPVAYTISALVARASAVSFVSGSGQLDTVASTTILFGVLALAVLSLHDAKRAARAALYALLAGSGVLLCLQVAHVMFPSTFALFGLLPGSASSIVGSWHDLSICAGLTVILACMLLQTSYSAKPLFAWSFRALVLLGIIILLVTNFVDTWFAVATAALLYSTYSVFKPHTRSNSYAERIRPLVPLIIFGVLAFLAGMFPAFIFSHLPVQLQVPQTEVRPSFEGTFAVGHPVFDGSRTFVFGSGPNTFMQQWARFKPLGVNATDFWNADFTSGVGVVPTSFVTVGLIGILSWLALVLALLWSAYHHVRENSEDAQTRTALVVACGYLLLFHVIYVPGMAVSITLFLLLGILAASKKLSSVEMYKTVSALGQSALIALAGILIVLASVLTLRTTASTLTVYRAAASYRASGDIGPALSLVNTAIHIDPNNDIAQRAAVEVGLIQFQKLAPEVGSDTAKRDALQASLSETISHALTAVSIDNTNYQNWFALAGLYQSLAGVGIQGAYEQARDAYMSAASTTPTNPLPLIQLAQTAMVKGDVDLAKNALDKAISLKQNLAAPYYLRSQIEVSRGDLKGAGEDGLAAAQLAAQDPLAWYNLGAILYAGNDPQDAIIAFERSVSLQADYSNALFALSVIYDQVGRHADALTAIRRVAELNPNDATVKQVITNIESGKPAMGQAVTPAKKK